MMKRESRITHIMVHHSLTKDSGTVSWPAIEKYHEVTEQWNDIGYHAGVESITDNPELYDYKYQALLGRAPYFVGSACPQGNMNRVGLHVCVVGNYDLFAPPQAILDCLINRIIRPWMIEYSIPVGNIVGHRDYNPAKSCPGTMFDLVKLRNMLR